MDDRIFEDVKKVDMAWVEGHFEFELSSRAYL